MVWYGQGQSLLEAPVPARRNGLETVHGAHGGQSKPNYNYYCRRT